MMRGKIDLGFLSGDPIDFLMVFFFVAGFMLLVAGISLSNMAICYLGVFGMFIGFIFFVTYLGKTFRPPIWG